MRIKLRLTFGKGPLKNNTRLQGKGIFRQNLMLSLPGDGALEIAGKVGRGGTFLQFLHEKLL